jgi:hypothetical protein
VAFGDKLFGLRELKITNADGSGVVALPIALIMHITPRIESAQFAAEGLVVGVAATLVAVDWEIEAGGISLDALAKLVGDSAAAAGSAPNRSLTLSADAGVLFPYVRVYGRAVGEGSDDIHCKLWRCKLTSIEGTFRVGEFWVTSAAGVAVQSASGLWDFVQHETGVVL